MFEAAKNLLPFLNRIEKEPDMQTLNESSLSRLQSKTVDHDCATMSAFRGDRQKAVNKTNSAAMKKALEAAGYSVTAIRGSFIENAGTDNEKKVSEDSFFVQNVKDDPDFVRVVTQLGHKYDQDSVLFIPKGGKGAYLVGTTKRAGADPSFGQKMKVGDASFGKITGDYFSSVGGRSFEFKEAKVLSESEVEADYPSPQTINGRIGARIAGRAILAEAALKKGFTDI